MKKKSNKKSSKLFQQALQLHQRGNINAAKDLYLQIIATDPKNPDALHNLGLAEYQTGNLTEAVKLINQAISVASNDASYYSNLAMCYSDLEEIDKAEENYRIALKKDSRSVSAQIGLGSLLAKQGNYKESEKYLAAVVKRKPDHVIANANYALTLQKLEKHQQALPFAKKAVKLDPGNAIAHTNLGNIYLDLGDFEVAQDCFRKALNLDISYGKAFNNLARSKKFTADDEDMNLVDQVNDFVRTHNLHQNNQIPIHFGLGKIYDDLQSWDKAFAHYKRGNSLVTSDYDNKALESKLKNIMRCFNSEWFSSHNEPANQDVAPIFIVGMPRSGTTLVEQIITSHAETYSIGESQAIPELVNIMPSLIDSEQPYPFCIDQLTVDSVAQLADRYMNLASESAFYESGKRPVDKMTTNYMHLGLIATVFPNAKIVLCTRDAIDTCLSCYFQDFDVRPDFAYRLENIGHFYNEYEKIVRYWRETLPVNIFDIHYDDLVTDTETTVRSLLEYCELSWDENCLHFYKSGKQVSTSSNWQVKQPIYKRSLYRWKNYEKHLAPLIEILNQQSDIGELTGTDSSSPNKGNTETSNNQSIFKKVMSMFGS